MKVSVLIPTCDRHEALAATLTSLAGQSYRQFDVVVADQGELPADHDPTVCAVARICDLHGNPVRIVCNTPRRGMAQQREFLLKQSRAAYSLFLDDDIILESDVLQRLVRALREERCGFAGMGLIGLSYQADVREDEQQVEWWDTPVHPEAVRPGSEEWERHKLHNAANLLHVARRLRPGEQRKYKIAWVGGCVLYDTEKLLDAGGFGFWPDLPREHCGEDVLAQLRVMEKYGAFGLLPSGAFHLELPTTLPNREVNAPEYLR
jgi:GT2 family glycosyltransferase